MRFSPSISQPIPSLQDSILWVHQRLLVAPNHRTVSLPRLRIPAYLVVASGYDHEWKPYGTYNCSRSQYSEFFLWQPSLGPRCIYYNGLIRRAGSLPCAKVWFTLTSAMKVQQDFYKQSKTLDWKFLKREKKCNRTSKAALQSGSPTSQLSSTNQSSMTWNCISGLAHSSYESVLCPPKPIWRFPPTKEFPYSSSIS